MRLNKSKFDNHKYISVHKHPIFDLYLYNYTHDCQYDKAWDEYTILSRGLILDGEGNVVQYPMKKFFNYGEGEGTKIDTLPKETPNVTIKDDGSLCGIFWYKSNLIVHTRGSFNSDQASWATSWLKQDIYKEFLRLNDECNSYWFEAIYPENRIVIDYKGYSGLKMITIFDKNDGREYSYKEMVKCAISYGFDFVYERKINHVRDLLEVVEKLGPNEEGFVMRYSNGLRVKIKGGEYVKLHKIMTGMNNRAIWEYMKEGKKIDLSNIPDELYDWIKKTEEDILIHMIEIENKAKDVYEEVKNMSTRKEQALHIIANYKDVGSIVFAMLDKKDVIGILWSMVEPKYERPFTGRKQVEENET